MEDWKVIHKIKDCKNKGMSKSAAATETNTDRKTVRKYWDMSEDKICNYLENRERKKELDDYKDYIVDLLKKYPKIKTPKIKRLLENKGVEIKVKERAFRYYINHLKEEVILRQTRYYKPVIDNLPGVQAQVDIGESRSVLINGKKTTIYFAVIVLSYSRQMFASWSLKPFNTENFVEFHDLAFKYFSGIPEELVYDQTKLVVIEEKYREVYFNDKFYQYATKVGFCPWVCEGYDPESKGKVEACVKYIKGNFLYGCEFESFAHLNKEFQDWLCNVANTRIHGTTKKRPCDMFYEEIEYLGPYTDVTLNKGGNMEKRRVDKTGLISVDGNKYSVPQIYQNQTILIEKKDNGYLCIYDKLTGESIYQWILTQEKGKIFRNHNHYRDYTISIKSDEEHICRLIPDEITKNILQLIKQNNSKIYKDQLYGLKKLCNKYSNQIILDVFKSLVPNNKPLKVSLIEEYIKSLINNTAQQEEKFYCKFVEKYSALNSKELITSQHKLNIYDFSVKGGKL